MENYRGGYQIIDLTKFYGDEISGPMTSEMFDEVKKQYEIYCKTDKTIVLNIGKYSFLNPVFNHFHDSNANYDIYCIWVNNNIVFSCSNEDNSYLLSINNIKKFITRINVSFVYEDTTYETYCNILVDSEEVEKINSSTISNFVFECLSSGAIIINNNVLYIQTIRSGNIEGHYDVSVKPDITNSSLDVTELEISIAF